MFIYKIKCFKGPFSGIKEERKSLDVPVCELDLLTFIA